MALYDPAQAFQNRGGGQAGTNIGVMGQNNAQNNAPVSGPFDPNNPFATNGAPNTMFSPNNPNASALTSMHQQLAYLLGTTGQDRATGVQALIQAFQQFMQSRYQPVGSSQAAGGQGQPPRPQPLAGQMNAMPFGVNNGY